MPSNDAVDCESTQTLSTKTAPISAYEKSLLLQLIEDRKIAIENRKTDFATYAKKTAAWEEVTTLFNSDGQTVKRSKEQLKKIWDNRKQNAKKAVTSYKKAIRKTGGGSGPQTLPPEVERISAMIPEQLNSLSNPFDSDAALEMNLNENPPVVVEKDSLRETQLFVEEVRYDDGISEKGTEKNIQEFDDDCFPPTKKNKKSKDPRCMLVEYEREEHGLRMKNLRLQEDILNAELRIKIRTLEMMEEEHVKKMKL